MEEEREQRGISRVEKMFARCKENGRRALIVYFCGGYPNLKYSEDLILAALEGGADMVEIGMPFSDPLADGPVIQAAAQESLAAGTRLSDIMEMGARIRGKYDNPLLLMTYYNPVLSYGRERLLEDMAGAGLDGILVPDLPLEESGELRGLALERGLCFIPFAAPTATGSRLGEICATACGFIYCISQTGTTGGKLDSFEESRELSMGVRNLTSKPIALGFGIAGPGDAAEAAPYFDGVIVGSALVRIITEYKSNRDECLKRVKAFVTRLKSACFI